MTEFADKFDAAIRTMMDATTSENEFSESLFEEWKAGIPGVDVVLSSHKDSFFRAVTRAKTRFTGGADFQDPSEALDRTTGVMFRCLYSDFVDVFGIGYVAGQKHLVEKLSNNDTVGLMVSGELAAPPEITLKFYEDEELKQKLEDIFRAQTKGYADYTGFTTYDKEGTKKIWDLWVLQAGTMGLIYYALGCTMGRSEREREAFAGLEDLSD